MPLDLDALADLIADTVKAETEPLKARIAELEAREPQRGEKGDPGEPGQPGRDGKDADLEDIAARLVPEVQRAVSENMPEPVPGPQGEKGDPGDPGVPGAEGRNADPAEVVPLLLPEIERAVSELPPPERGPQGDRGEKGDPGADGINMAGGFVDQRGHLMLTRSNGDVQDAGLVKGADGAPGRDGTDGVDGLGFEDMEETLEDDGRTIVRRYRRGDKVREFRHRLAVVLDRGVFKDGTAYAAGDGVSYGGQFWIAQKETTEKPVAGADGWRLSIKRGRDGKAVDNEQVARVVMPMLAPHVEKAIRKGIAEGLGRKDG